MFEHPEILGNVRVTKIASRRCLLQTSKCAKIVFGRTLSRTLPILVIFHPRAHARVWCLSVCLSVKVMRRCFINVANVLTRNQQKTDVDTVQECKGGYDLQPRICSINLGLPWLRRVMLPMLSHVDYARGWQKETGWCDRRRDGQTDRHRTVS